MRELDLKTDVTFKGRKFVVSTVDLFGVNYGDDENPLYYETMIFAYDSDGKVNFCDLYCERYATKEEATKRHKEIGDYENVDIKLWNELRGTENE